MEDDKNSDIILEEHDMEVGDSYYGAERTDSFAADDDAPPTLPLHEIPTSAKKLPYNRIGMARKVQRMQNTLFPTPAATTFSPLKMAPFSPAPASSLNPRPLSSFDANINKPSSPPYKRAHDWSGLGDDDDNNINKKGGDVSPIPSTRRTSPPKRRGEQSVPDREVSDAESESSKPFLQPTLSPVKSSSFGGLLSSNFAVSGAMLSCVPSMDRSLLTTGTGDRVEKRSGNFIDSGLSMGRSFRAGWGSQGQIVTIGR
jgi:hypothetical protein